MKQAEILLKQTLVLVVGPPASGKSTIAKFVVSATGITHFDIDDIRAHFFGIPKPNDGANPEIVARDECEMAGTYNIMLGIIDGFLRAGRPLLLTCTLSSKKWGQERVKAICDQYPGANLKIVWCWPEITKDQLAERLERRSAGGDYIGATTDPDRAWELRGKYQAIELPHLKLDTGPANEPEASAKEALQFILS